ncbi:hypothetical protein TKK_0015322 [Trichogramma kaykai]
MHESKAQSTPKVTRQVKNKESKVEEYVPLENQNFRAAIGSLMYLATVTRPDIAYAVNYLSRKQVAPSEEDWKDVKRIFRYLQGTRDVGLIYKANNENMYCHTNSSFRDHQDSTSTSVYVIKLFGDAISWRSHKQVYVSLSTCQAEYLAMSEAAAEIVSLDKVIRDMLENEADIMTKPLPAPSHNYLKDKILNRLT